MNTLVRTQESSFVAILVSCLAALIPLNSVLSQEIPFSAQWTLSEADETPFTDSVDIAMYDANWIIEADLIEILDFDCNAKFKITAAKSTWTLPANYPTAGAKKADGSDSDLLLMVDHVTPGYDPASEGLAALGGYGSYTAIATSGSDIIGGGAVGEGAHGIENGACDVNAKILMDWGTDIVGAYSITVTLTISEVTE